MKSPLAVFIRYQVDLFGSNRGSGTATRSLAAGGKDGEAAQQRASEPFPQVRVGSTSPRFPLLAALLHAATSHGCVTAWSHPKRMPTAQAFVGFRSIAASWSSVTPHLCFLQGERTEIRLGVHGCQAQRHLQHKPALPGYLNVQPDDPQVPLRHPDVQHKHRFISLPRYSGKLSLTTTGLNLQKE